MPDLLLEIGTEELPPREIGPALAQLAEEIRAALDLLRLDVGGVATSGTPRRLVVFCNGVAARQRPAVREVRGPAAQAAYDESGRPTPAATGFARSQGLAVEKLRVAETAGRRYVIAVLEEAGRPAAAVLPAALTAAISRLIFTKTMRWGSGEERFARPVRWVLALLGSTRLPVEVAGVRAGRRTYGHRFLSPRARTVRDARSYFRTLAAANVIADPQIRRRRITSQAKALAARVKAVPVLDPQLLEETVMSVEHPQALRGSFAPEFLTLPGPVLVTVMQHHQKYFPTADRRGRLQPHFIAVRDGSARRLGTVREGHEWVLRARLADARFFFDQDRARLLEAYLPRLDGLVFHAQLGTVAEKARRLTRLAQHLAVALLLDGHAAVALQRAAALCKADLVTHMVGEFPELQGVIGGIYAEMDGEAPEVARAIGEHYRPAGSGDGPPATRLGALLGLIDKCDTLTGGIAAGLMPTGSQDPYGLRRAGQGIVEIILAHRLAVPLRPLIDAAARGYDRGPEQAGDEVVEFLRQRLRGLLIERGLRYDLVDAALAVSGDDLLAAAGRAQALQQFSSAPGFARLYVAYDRASRILTDQVPERIDPALFDSESERLVFDAARASSPTVEAAAASGDYRRALEALVPIAAPVDRLFDDVLIMASDERVRANRLALLSLVVRVFRNVADFSKVVMSDPKDRD